jgi:GR25 family glycosyltransferase involved in LPS biosynthesis
LTYEDGTGRHEYVVFADSARKASIPQYFDNRQIYGYITFGEGDGHYVAGGIDQARALLKTAGDKPILAEPTAVAPSHAAPQSAPNLPIHLINLDRSAQRLAAFQKYNNHLRNVIRVSAVDGRLLNRDRLIQDGLVTPDCDYKAGALACALSHANLWKKAVAENTIMTIFEDDAIATDRFEEKAAQLIAKLPKDWDFIQWGYNFNPLFVWADFGFSKATLRFYGQQFQGADKSKFQSTSLVPSAIKLAHSYGTVAYSVSPKGAGLLLKHCLPLRKQLIPFPGTGIVNVDEGIDCAMNNAYSAMQAFISIPPLVLEDKLLNSDRVATDGGTLE